MDGKSLPPIESPTLVVGDEPAKSITPGGYTVAPGVCDNPLRLVGCDAEVRCAKNGAVCPVRTAGTPTHNQAAMQSTGPPTPHEHEEGRVYPNDALPRASHT
jgi:hypothetical protein